MLFALVRKITLLLCVSAGICQDASFALRGSAARAENSAAVSELTAPIDITNSASKSVLVASSCENTYEVAPGESINVSIAANGSTFWILPEGTDWNCSTPCSQCFHFSISVGDDGRLRVGVGQREDIELRSASAYASNNQSVGAQEQSSENESSTYVAGVQLWIDNSDEAISCTTAVCDQNPLSFASGQAVSLQILGDDVDTQSTYEGPLDSNVDDTLGALNVANGTLQQTVDAALDGLNRSLLQSLAIYDPDMYETSVASTLGAHTEFQQILENVSNDLAGVFQDMDLESARSSHGDPILNALNGLLRQKLNKINGLAGSAIKEPYPFPVHVDKAQMQYVTGLRSIKVSNIKATKLDLSRGILYLNLNGYFRKFITAVGEIDILHSRVEVLLGPHVSWSANGIKAYVNIAKKSVKRFQVGQVGVHIRGILGRGYFPGNPTRPDGLITSAVNNRLPKYYGFIKGAFRQQFKKTLQSTLNRFKDQFSFR